MELISQCNQTLNMQIPSEIGGWLVIVRKATGTYSFFPICMWVLTVKIIIFYSFLQKKFLRANFNIKKSIIEMSARKKGWKCVKTSEGLIG